MSKKKVKQRAETQIQQETLQQETESEETIETPEVEAKAGNKWSFPTVSRCPRCGTTDTICRRTDNKLGRQYRICKRAVCRKTYTVFGEKV